MSEYEKYELCKVIESCNIISKYIFFEHSGLDTFDRETIENILKKLSKIIKDKLNNKEE